MKLHLKIWRQKDATSKGQMIDYPLNGVESD
ncbi:MAG: succinate dehydrogenase/fumarate reductase iron-sulfur subunit, partial [Bacteroidota bacterium]